MSGIFRFKQFSVNQGGCAMKINTDGVLLGASVLIGDLDRILDIGTGTGVIALMLAQKFENAVVDAVEIDQSAAARARSNFEHSSFHDRLNIWQVDFASFAPENRYDLIITNPPFYTNSLHNPDERRKTAKHTNLQFFQQLFAFSNSYLSDIGSLKMIVPSDLGTVLRELALEKYNLYLQREVRVFSFVNGPIIRKIMCFSRQPCASIDQPDFVIYEEKDKYTDEYKTLLKPYFLAF